MAQAPNTSLAFPVARPERSVLSCVVPAYNEAGHLAAFIEDLAQALKPLCESYEIIVVNDGSTDNTESVMASLLPRPGLRYLSLARNFGKEVALTAGIEHARGDAVLLIDADYQHPLALLPEMVRLWREGYDMVYGVLASREKESLLRRWGVGAFYGLMELSSSIHMPRHAGDFRLLDRQVADALRQLPERNRFMKGLYAWVGYRSIGLPFTPAERASGQSSFNLHRLAQLAVNGVMAFTTLPLRIWSGIGAVISLIAFFYGLYIVVEHLIWGSDVRGWPTLAAGLMFFSGIQLISIGIVGQYLSQVYDEVKRRPLYLLARDVDGGVAAHADRPVSPNASGPGGAKEGRGP
ncbi:glycosyltransferase [Hylemonella sp. W303a]|uniref:glycosyltransferase n=1 Tax=Hylemonella sp. W303a TaxID=3389873 RepID=UPI00396AF3A4